MTLMFMLEPEKWRSVDVVRRQTLSPQQGAKIPLEPVQPESLVEWHLLGVSSGAAALL